MHVTDDDDAALLPNHRTGQRVLFLLWLAACEVFCLIVAVVVVQWCNNEINEERVKQSSTSGQHKFIINELKQHFFPEFRCDFADQQHCSTGACIFNLDNLSLVASWFVSDQCRAAPKQLGLWAMNYETKTATKWTIELYACWPHYV